jgi:hypothetical protein
VGQSLSVSDGVEQIECGGGQEQAEEVGHEMVAASALSICLRIVLSFFGVAM